MADKYKLLFLLKTDWREVDSGHYNSYSADAHRLRISRDGGGGDDGLGHTGPQSGQPGGGGRGLSAEGAQQQLLLR